MDYASCRSLPAMFFATARQRAQRPFLWAKHDGHYRSLSWAEAESAVTRLAQALVAYGIEPGDRVVLVSENRPEWIIADLAIMSAGAITVPAYVTNTGNDHRHVLGNSGAHAVIVSTAALAARALPAAAQTPSIKFAIAMEPVGDFAAPFPVHGWQAARGADARARRHRRADCPRLRPTTRLHHGAPGHWDAEGKLLTHRNIISNCRAPMAADARPRRQVFCRSCPPAFHYEHLAA